MKTPQISSFLKRIFLGTTVFFLSTVTFVTAGENETMGEKKSLTAGEMSRAESELSQVGPNYDENAPSATSTLLPFPFVRPNFREIISLSLSEVTALRSDIRNDIQMEEETIDLPQELGWLAEFSRRRSEEEEGENDGNRRGRSKGRQKENEGENNEEREVDLDDVNDLSLSDLSINITLFTVKASFYGDLTYSISRYFFLWFQIGEIVTGDLAPGMDKGE